MLQHSRMSTDHLIEQLTLQRQYTLDYLLRLTPSQWIGEKSTYLNPPLWEWLHIIWFQEYWLLRCDTLGQPNGRASRLAHADAYFDSSKNAHAQRWQTPLPSISRSMAYADAVFNDVRELIFNDKHSAYFAELSLYHEAMHEENFMRRAQYLAQAFRATPVMPLAAPQMLHLKKQSITLAPNNDGKFQFDNEKGECVKPITPIAMRNTPVAETEFLAFIDDDGYQRREFWSDEGWQWRITQQVNQPYYWRKIENQWQVREFEQWRSIEATQAIRYISAFEAEAYCRYRKCRLPTAAEWFAATMHERFFVAPTWEWTADYFQAYDGFSPDPYHEYSQPSFAKTRELRGHSPLQHSGLCRPTFRNFFAAQRRDVCAGLRICHNQE